LRRVLRKVKRLLHKVPKLNNFGDGFRKNVIINYIYAHIDISRTY